MTEKPYAVVDMSGKVVAITKTKRQAELTARFWTRAFSVPHSAVPASEEDLYDFIDQYERSLE